MVKESGKKVLWLKKSVEVDVIRYATGTIELEYNVSLKWDGEKMAQPRVSLPEEQEAAISVTRFNEDGEESEFKGTLVIRAEHVEIQHGGVSGIPVPRRLFVRHFSLGNGKMNLMGRPNSELYLECNWDHA